MSRTRIPGPFRMKRFEIQHSRSSMRVGVDAVNLGAWVSLPDKEDARILDVGTGCGLLALMLAQRMEDAGFSRFEVTGIDIHDESVAEASGNFASSPWVNHLGARLCDFTAMETGERYDLIISNPPYFRSGIGESDMTSARLTARHQGELSPMTVLTHGIHHLSSDGRIALVLPKEFADETIEAGLQAGLFLERQLIIQGHPDAPAKRILLQFSTEEKEPIQESIVLESEPGCPTEEYKMLCRDFYLKF